MSLVEEQINAGSLEGVTRIMKEPLTFDDALAGILCSVQCLTCMHVLAFPYVPRYLCKFNAYSGKVLGYML